MKRSLDFSLPILGLVWPTFTPMCQEHKSFLFAKLVILFVQFLCFQVYYKLSLYMWSRYFWVFVINLRFRKKHWNWRQKLRLLRHFDDHKQITSTGNFITDKHIIRYLIYITIISKSRKLIYKPSPVHVLHFFLIGSSSHSGKSESNRIVSIEVSLISTPLITAFWAQEVCIYFQSLDS